ncbi:ferritin-like protein [Paraneptunicella aestuarii]|uniref:ferritin-like domain-containing protein n=1 Tax=Paraneptunicella aestuarii TaxID=2831148 RepID=UPI001E558ED5|nr:ferritin-like protein [Paraneptunicella aestuarii]UAA39847.1 ferritin-like protein [Paraneptunicella aestuarii]
MLQEFKLFDEYLETCHRDGGIHTLEQLHHDLHIATQLEFSTLPPYLCALYTISDTTNPSAYYTIRSVVMEEMFHLANAANVLIAVGGKPKLNCSQFVPTYPTKLPNGEKWFDVELLPFSQAALGIFKNIEIPGDMVPEPVKTIGKFYERIQHGLNHLYEKMGDALFPADTAPQVTANYYYGGGGEITPVTDLASAQFAINAIIAQGEGKPVGDWDPTKPFPLEETTGILDGDHELFNQHREIAHYFRFDELAQGKRYVCGDSPQSGPTGPAININWQDVYNMHPNPTAALYENIPELKQLNREFNLIFSRLLDELNTAFNGEPDKLLQAVGTMYKLKYAAQEMFRNPIPGSPEGYYAGPTWEYIAE